MKRLLVLVGIVTLMATFASAQLPAPNASGVSMGHLHLNTRDIEASKKFWTAVGGTPVKFAQFEMFKFPDVLVILNSNNPSGTGEGSVVNHVGFLVPNVQQSMAKWKAAGLSVELGQNRTDQAYLTSPDGQRIEILEDK